MTSIGRTLFLITLMMSTSAGVQAKSDQFSRANCGNNESITYDYFDPPQWRAVFSHHFESGSQKHYVTENPAAICVRGVGGYHQVNGRVCLHYPTYKTRHAAVHGLFLSSEPNPDGFLSGTSDWSVLGYHATIIPRVGYRRSVTSATSCNLRFEQFY